MRLDRIGMVVHSGKAEATRAAEEIRAWGVDRGVETVELDVWHATERRTGRDETRAIGLLDLIVTIGGDGTFLRGVHIAAVVDCPVLGVNVGRVGFLTEVPPERTIETLEAARVGPVDVEERMTLTMRASRPLEIPPELGTLLRYGRGPAMPPPGVRDSTPEAVGWGVPLDVVAVNDVVFEKLARDRQASLGIYISGRLFASYSADAVMVSTATGSTAYSFAAGGPVLSPLLDALVFTPVAPHMAFNRSLLFSPQESVGVRVLPRSGQVAVSIDGQLRGVLDPGDWVAAYAAPWRLRILRFGSTDFFGRLRDRFSLADAPAATADGDAPLVYRPDSPVPEDLRHLRDMRA
ncbi:NAD(+)/NADH kinase [Micromonospora sp. WMMD975]|uniref:NAD(+)/NADH kinase n=1 Tax=Micromonospora sp. WMMD975 TaxID=3016087 RepID=UPI00249CB7CD|nr:NAD(+)/NADH kinase [Micromonospora sp. WMMD975]WFE34621.1 NAD(+)/NADH kinase [Micromonospora sp. WMMD975]